MATQNRVRTAGRFEPLEPKQMLAGDVVVDVVDGNLLIRGDEEGNQIAISSGEAPGSYLIRGLNGTVVSMASDDDQAPAAAPETGLVVEGVRRDVNIRLGGGDDTVQVTEATVRGALRIATGDGADRVLIGVPGTPPGPQPADPAGGDVGVGAPDALDTSGVSVGVGRGLRITTGDGGDEVRVDQTAIRGRLAVSTGGGADTVAIGGPEATPPPSTDAGPDADGPLSDEDRASVRVGGAVRVALGEGEDRLGVSNTTARRVSLHGGTDADQIGVNDVRALSILVNGGRGDAGDSVTLRGVRAGFGRVATGAGDDTVQVVDSAFGVLAASLGAGDDSLAISGVSARVALLLGGAGEADLLRDGGDNRFGRRLIRGFELPSDDSDEGESGDERLA